MSTYATRPDTDISASAAGLRCVRRSNASQTYRNGTNTSSLIQAGLNGERRIRNRWQRYLRRNTETPVVERIQRKRTKGWRMPPNTVSVTRPGRWGNPYTIKDAREAGYGGTEAQLAQWCVECFRDAVSGKLLFAEPVPTIRAAQIKALASGLACQKSGGRLRKAVL
jgi:hypothetical protein